MSHHHEFNRFIPYIIFLLRLIATIHARWRPNLRSQLGRVIKWARLYEQLRQ